VCPHCQRDKTADKKVIQNIQGLTLVGGIAGFFAGSIAGAVIGAILAFVVAKLIFRSKGTKPPEVVPVGLALAASPVECGGDTGRRLAELESLRKTGLVSDSEYSSKRRAILDAL
jgi:hypothetical protein